MKENTILSSYIKKNILLNIILLVSIMIIILFQLTKNKPVIFNLNVEIVNYYYEIIVNLSIGYIVSLIFYVIVVFYPEEKRKRSTMNIIQPRLNTIVEVLDKSILYLKDKRLNMPNKAIDDLVENDFMNVTSLDNRKMDFHYKILSKDQDWIKFTTGEILEIDSFFHDKELLVKKINEIISLPTIIYVDNRLVESLVKLRDCQFYIGVESFSEAKFINSKAIITISGKEYKLEVSNFNQNIYTYYLLYLELKQFVVLNDIKNTSLEEIHNETEERNEQHIGF